MPVGSEGSPSSANGEVSSSPVNSEQAVGGSAAPGEAAGDSAASASSPGSAVPGTVAEEEAAEEIDEEAPALTAQGLAGISLAPQAAVAVGMSAGVHGLTVNTSTVMFAGQEWWVIGDGSSGVAPLAGHATLLAKDPYGLSAFRQGATTQNDPSWVQYPIDGQYYEGSFAAPGDYSDSSLQRSMAALAANSVIFPAAEAALITPRDIGTDGIGGAAVTGQKLWALSANEWSTIGNDTVRNFVTYFWLRSQNGGNNAYVGQPSGHNTASRLVSTSTIAVRPALQLNLSSVFFPSAAVGGKPVTAGPSLSAVTAPGDSLKLTLFDDAITLGTASPASVDGRTVSFAYTGATTGPNQFISALIKDSAGAVKFYGKLAANIQANGTASVTLPDGFAAGDTLHIFAEQANGDKLTDYASATKTIAIALQAAPASPAGGAQITGVDSSMEYKPASASGWTAITGSSVTGLAAGSYQVRYAGKVASGGVATLASPAKTVTVNTPAITGVSITPATASVLKGESRQFTATVSVEYGAPKTVVWDVNSKLSSIDNTGKLTVGAKRLQR